MDSEIKKIHAKLDKMQKTLEDIRGPKQASTVAQSRLTEDGWYAQPESTEKVLDNIPYVKLDWIVPAIEGVAQIKKNSDGFVTINISFNSVEGKRVEELIDILHISGLTLSVADPV